MLQFGTIHTCEFFYLHHQKVASVFGVNPLGYISQLSVYLMNMSRLMKGILALLSAEMISWRSHAVNLIQPTTSIALKEFTISFCFLLTLSIVCYDAPHQKSARILVCSTLDSQLRSTICCITNSNLSDVQWLRTSLPVGDDGLGIKRAVEFITALKLTETVMPFCVQNRQKNGK